MNEEINTHEPFYQTAIIIVRELFRFHLKLLKNTFNLNNVVEVTSERATYSIFRRYLTYVVVSYLSLQFVAIFRPSFEKQIAETALPVTLLTVYLASVIIASTYHFTNSIYPQRELKFLAWVNLFTLIQLNTAFAIVITALVVFSMIFVIEISINGISILDFKLSGLSEKYFYGSIILILFLSLPSYFVNAMQILRMSCREKLVFHMIMPYVIILVAFISLLIFFLTRFFYAVLPEGVKSFFDRFLNFLQSIM